VPENRVKNKAGVFVISEDKPNANHVRVRNRIHVHSVYINIHHHIMFE
jgi:lipoate-protein ligase B